MDLEKKDNTIHVFFACCPQKFVSFWWVKGPLRLQARETGICPVREELYSQCFDELIRQAPPVAVGWLGKKGVWSGAFQKFKDSLSGLDVF